MNYLAQFKHILEYFVAHLEWVQNDDTPGPGYSEYIAPIVNKPNFRKNGQGYNGDNIQNGISEWEKFPDGTICINIQHYWGKDYKTKLCYLNWMGTGVNVIALWNGNHINSLEVVNCIHWEKPKRWERGYIKSTISSLGLFNKEESANAELEKFFNIFSDLYKRITVMDNNQTIIDILKSNHNIILNGAPGTGKTYLAKSIAAQMISGKLFSSELESDENFKAHCRFVQFHPSYDYTDFVEGLRPKKDAQGNVTFERKNGIFKDFCKDAINALVNNEVDNFDEAWTALINDLDEKGKLSIPSLSGSRQILIELNTYGDGLVERTYDDTLEGDNGWVPGKSKFFSKEQLYNIYRGQPGIPSTGHDNYRKAIVKEMKKSYGLKEYSKGIENSDGSSTPFIFIIDEINRGEMSKIFGELFFSIDPGYRGKAGLIMTQYQNLIEPTDIFFEGFYVPKNVYIIGTMNDIDRSVESMDFAMRRRFAFMEIMADENTSMLDGIKEKTDVIAKMNAINQLISAEEELGSSYHIGGAYFKKVDLCRTTDGEINWEDFWNRYLYRLIYEYVRGFQNRQELLDRMKAAIVPQDNHNSTQN